MLYFAIGSDADRETLEQLIEESMFIGNAEDKKTEKVLQKNIRIFFKLGAFEKNIRNYSFAPVRKMGIIKRKTDGYSLAEEGFIDIFYTDKLKIEDSVNQLNIIFNIMQQVEIYPPNITPSLRLSFAGAINSHEAPYIPLTLEQYRKSILRVKYLMDLKRSSGYENAWASLFYKDLKRIKYLEFEDAVRLTRNINETIMLKGDLIIRAELIEAGCTSEGQWMALLPVKDYLIPETNYLSDPLLHSRIDETWHSSRRKKLIRQLQKDRIRGYWFQLSSGMQFTIFSRPDVIMEDMEYFSMDKVTTILEGSDSVFDKFARHIQVEKAIAYYTSLLKEANVSTRDIIFYVYWTKKLWNRDRPQETWPDKVIWRYEELDKIRRGVKLNQEANPQRDGSTIPLNQKVSHFELRIHP